MARVPSNKSSPEDQESPKVLQRKRVPGSFFEVDEEGYVRIPEELLKNLFRGVDKLKT